MVAIGVWTEGDPAVAHLAKPIELSVKSEVLQDAENSHQEPETHHEPDEAAPILKRPERLRGQKEKKDVGKEKLEFHARAVRRGSEVKQPLAEGDQQQSRPEAKAEEKIRADSLS